jgi:hypothetical protein
MVGHAIMHPDYSFHVIRKQIRLFRAQGGKPNPSTCSCNLTGSTGLAPSDKRHLCRHYSQEEDIRVEGQTCHVHDGTCNLLWVNRRFNLH